MYGAGSEGSAEFRLRRLLKLKLDREKLDVMLEMMLMVRDLGIGAGTRS